MYIIFWHAYIRNRWCCIFQTISACGAFCNQFWLVVASKYQSNTLGASAHQYICPLCGKYGNVNKNEGSKNPPNIHTNKEYYMRAPSIISIFITTHSSSQQTPADRAPHIARTNEQKKTPSSQCTHTQRQTDDDKHQSSHIHHFEYGHIMQRIFKWNWRNKSNSFFNTTSALVNGRIIPTKAPTHKFPNTHKCPRTAREKNTMRASPRVCVEDRVVCHQPNVCTSMLEYLLAR